MTRLSILACALIVGLMLPIDSPRGNIASAADAPTLLLDASKVLLDASKVDTLIKPFLAAHCNRCHGAAKQEGKLRLDTLPLNFTASDSARHWIETMDRLNAGEMPPEGEPKPEVHQSRAVAVWLAAELRHAARQSLTHGGRVVLRRMNRMEYANTIRDLFEMAALPGESPLEILPPDGTAEGFDKVGAALMLDPSLLEKYFEVAAQVAARAIVDGPPEFATHKKRFEFEDTAKNRAINYLCASAYFECREHDALLYDGGARSFGRKISWPSKTTSPSRTPNWSPGMTTSTRKSPRWPRRSGWSRPIPLPSPPRTPNCTRSSTPRRPPRRQLRPRTRRSRPRSPPESPAREH